MLLVLTIAETNRITTCIKCRPDITRLSFTPHLTQKVVRENFSNYMHLMSNPAGVDIEARHNNTKDFFISNVFTKNTPSQTQFCRTFRSEHTQCYKDSAIKLSTKLKQLAWGRFPWSFLTKCNWFADKWDFLSKSIFLSDDLTVECNVLQDFRNGIVDVSFSSVWIYVKFSTIQWFGITEKKPSKKTTLVI